MKKSNEIKRTCVSLPTDIYFLAKKNDIPFSETLRDGIIQKIKDLRSAGILESEN